MGAPGPDFAWCWICGKRGPAGRNEREDRVGGCSGPICVKCAGWLDAFHARERGGQPHPHTCMGERCWCKAVEVQP